MIKPLLDELGITIHKSCGDELIADCPLCEGKNKLYINNKSGAWQCKKGCGEGYPYQLIRDMTGKQQPKEIFDLLVKYNLVQETAKQSYSVQEASLIPMPLLNQMVFAAAKRVDRISLSKLNPMYSRDGVVYLPVNTPAVNKPIGYIRANITGEPFEDGSKYLLTTGAKVGLLGLNNIDYDQPQIYYVEGWKDLTVAISLGLNAVSPSHGAGSFDENWLPLFSNKKVLTIFDRDKAGEAGQHKITEKLNGIAKKVKHIILPYELKKSKGKDLYDFIISDGGNIDQCETIEHTPETEAKTFLLPDDYPDTLAEFFEEYSRENGVIHRYHPTDGWSIYTNDYYQQVDGKQQIAKYLSTYLRRCYYEDERGKTKRIRANNSRINDILQQLSFLDGVYLKPSQAAPCFLDSGNKCNDNVVCLQNGILDYSRSPYQLTPPTPNFYSFSRLPYLWEGEYDSELWIKYLVDVTGGDEDLHTLLQQWAGYCLLKNDQSQQKFMLIYGAAGSGKSVYMDVLSNMLGKENVSSVPLAKFDEIHLVSQTYGKLLNATDESSNYVEKEVENSLKHYTGGTLYTFKRMYQEPFSAYPTAKIMIATNEKPEFKDTSEGIWRRLLLVPFNNVFTGENRDLTLKDKIMATELPFVLKWALEGARKLQKYGFIEPEVCRQELIEYQYESLPELRFIHENYVAGELPFGASPTTCEDVRIRYERFCQNEGIKPKSTKKLGHALRKIYPAVERKRARVNNQLTYIYDGLIDVNYNYELEQMRW